MNKPLVRLVRHRGASNDEVCVSLTECRQALLKLGSWEYRHAYFVKHRILRRNRLARKSRQASVTKGTMVEMHSKTSQWAPIRTCEDLLKKQRRLFVRKTQRTGLKMSLISPVDHRFLRRLSKRRLYMNLYALVTAKGVSTPAPASCRHMP